MKFYKYIRKNKYVLIFTILTAAVNLIKMNNVDLLMPFIGLIISLFLDRYFDIRLLRSMNLLHNNQNQENLRLMQNEDKFRKLFTLSQDPICIFNIKTMRFINVNKKFCNILDYTIEELTSQYFTNFVYEEDLEFAANLITDLNNNEETKEAEIRFISKCGEIKDLKWYFYFTSDATGFSYCFVKEIKLRE